MAERERFALEKFEISQLTVWHIIKSKGSGYFAYVRDPDNFIHHVEVGEYLGSHNGRVNSISKCKVVVSELVADKSGGWVERPTTLVSLEDGCR